MRYPATTSAMLVGVLLLGASRPVLASCAGKLLCTEFTDPPTRQEVVVAPANVRAKTETQAHPRRSRSTRTVAQGSKKHAVRSHASDNERRAKQTPPAKAPQPEPQVAGAEAAAPARMAAPEPKQDAVSRPPNPNFLIEDGFNAMLAGPSDDPEQQALFVLHYLTGRARASAVSVMAPVTAPVVTPVAALGPVEESAPSPASDGSRPSAEIATSVPLRHVAVLDVAAALGGIGSIAAAFTVLSGWRLRLQSGNARDGRRGFSLPVPVAPLKPKSVTARAPVSLEVPVRKQAMLRAEHLIARRSRAKAVRTGAPRVSARPTARTHTS